MRSFIQELAHSEKTGNTECFNAYTEGSYHLNKLDLIEGINTHRDSLTRDVEALLIVGPSGPMWSYNIITILVSPEHQDSVIVNHLIFTHARVRYKSTAMVSKEKIEELSKTIFSSALLIEPTVSHHTMEGEYAISMALVKFSKDTKVHVLPSSSTKDQEKLSNELYQAVNNLLSMINTKITHDNL